MAPSQKMCCPLCEIETLRWNNLLALFRYSDPGERPTMPQCTLIYVATFSWKKNKDYLKLKAVPAIAAAHMQNVSTKPSKAGIWLRLFAQDLASQMDWRNYQVFAGLLYMACVIASTAGKRYSYLGQGQWLLAVIWDNGLCIEVLVIYAARQDVEV